jgi:hypothetical protein
MRDGERFILEAWEAGAEGAMESEKCGIKVRLFCRDGWRVCDGDALTDQEHN